MNIYLAGLRQEYIDGPINLAGLNLYTCQRPHSPTILRYFRSSSCARVLSAWSPVVAGERVRG